MMKIVVLDAATMGADMDFSPLYALGEVEVYQHTSQEEVLARITDADVLVLNKTRLGEHNLADAKRPLLIAITATGFDNVDVAYCREQGIAVANVAGYSTDSVAQLTFATALSLACHLRAYNDYVASGAYTASNCFNRLTPAYHELAGKTWGIVGLGNIGMKVARIAEAFGCRVIAYTRTPKSQYPCLSLEEVCSEADIISLHTPLNDATKGLISREMLAKMKPGVILVNEARGAVVDEAAVADAVLAGRLYYGADVYSAEPFPAESPIYTVKENPRVCLTPHMAWGSVEARERCLGEVCQNILAYKDGIRRNRVD
jgi:glycerate dehydrogenase